MLSVRPAASLAALTPLCDLLSAIWEQWALYILSTLVFPQWWTPWNQIPADAKGLLRTKYRLWLGAGAHACNPSYSRSRDQEDPDSKSALENSSWDSISKILSTLEAMLGISLYSYLYLKLAKTLCLSYHCLCLLFNKIGEEGRAGSAWKRGGGGSGKRWPKQCMHVWINE
jgi:hypothetical protein